MSRKHTPSRIFVSEPVTDSKLRAQVQGLGEAANSVEGNQMEAGGILGTSMGLLADQGTSPQTTSKGALNTFSYLSNFPVGSTDTYASDGILSATWRAFTSPDGFSAFPQYTLEAPPGMLIGSVMFDGAIYGTTDNPGGLGSGVIINPTAWWEIGVFVDDRLVARSGRVYIGRRTIELPFGTPTSNETTNIQVRYRGNIGTLNDTDGTAGGTLDIRPFSVYAWHVWSRHTQG